ncbi:hypothetical protein CYLTODRAFT_415738 [Cylindrobasidium torrendii FP15055 ss-10]|uniref:Uncharacterized protein n=1 Tax=Cylindrobasidium torrendii FP15055 ss-10 TaxID=1314674 RepID=A0A0D7ASL2_9AGAR|nr:hypothetical protein CYLTODRAFT_415738 [Cylindrobasidium torrendii FP15055 ss-10]
MYKCLRACAHIGATEEDQVGIVYHAFEEFDCGVKNPRPSAEFEGSRIRPKNGGPGYPDVPPPLSSWGTSFSSFPLTPSKKFQKMTKKYTKQSHTNYKRRHNTKNMFGSEIRQDTTKFLTWTASQRTAREFEHWTIRAYGSNEVCVAVAHFYPDVDWASVVWSPNPNRRTYRMNRAQRAEELREVDNEMGGTSALDDPYTASRSCKCLLAVAVTAVLAGWSGYRLRRRWRDGRGGEAGGAPFTWAEISGEAFSRRLARSLDYIVAVLLPKWTVEAFANQRLQPRLSLCTIATVDRTGVVKLVGPARLFDASSSSRRQLLVPLLPCSWRVLFTPTVKRPARVVLELVVFGFDHSVGIRVRTSWLILIAYGYRKFEYLSDNISLAPTPMLSPGGLPSPHRHLPVYLFRQCELFGARLMRLLLATGRVPGIFHSSAAHPNLRELNEGAEFYLLRPPSDNPSANWSPMLFGLSRYLLFVSEHNIEDELSPVLRRCLPFMANALRYWLFDSEGGVRRILGWDEAQRNEVLALSGRFGDTQPSEDSVVPPFRCSLFVTRDLSIASEYIVEVGEMHYDLTTMESEMHLWSAQAMQHRVAELSSAETDAGSCRRHAPGW